MAVGVRAACAPVCTGLVSLRPPTPQHVVATDGAGQARHALAAAASTRRTVSSLASPSLGGIAAGQRAGVSAHPAWLAGWRSPQGSSGAPAPTAAMPDNPLSINPDGNRKSAMVNTAHLKTLQEMDAEEIGEWLTTCGYGDYADKFVAHNVSGDAVPQLASADLKEIGVDKVVSAASNRSAARCRLTQTVAGHQGDRVRLLKDLREFRVAMEIEHRWFMPRPPAVISPVPSLSNRSNTASQARNTVQMDRVPVVLLAVRHHVLHADALVR